MNHVTVLCVQSVIDCGQLPVLTNTFNYSLVPVKTTYGSSFSYMCYIGYWLDTNKNTALVTCDSAGHWSNAVNCTRMCAVGVVDLMNLC